VNDAAVTEYLSLRERIVVEALFAEAAVEQELYDRLDRLWYTEMTADDRREAEVQMAEKARAWRESRKEDA
jgi:hypothetical protein